MEVKFREKFEKDLESITNTDVLADIEKTIENVEKAKKPQDIINHCRPKVFIKNDFKKFICKNFKKL